MWRVQENFDSLRKEMECDAHIVIYLGLYRLAQSQDLQLRASSSSTGPPVIPLKEASQFQNDTRHIMLTYTVLLVKDQLIWSVRSSWTMRNEIHMKNDVFLHCMGVPFCVRSFELHQYCIKILKHNKNIPCTIFIWMEITELLKAYKLTERTGSLSNSGTRVAGNILIYINCVNQALTGDILF